MNRRFSAKDFIKITLITSIWVHVSQLARFLAYVRSELQDYLPSVPNIAPMDSPITLAIWGAWDMLLTALYVFLFWLCAQVFGNSRKSILISGLTSWCFFFVLFWVGYANMNLLNWSPLIIILPLALLETLVASVIASALYRTPKHSLG